MDAFKEMAKKNNEKTAISVTFCESGEQHIGMGMVGKRAEEGKGFNKKDFQNAKKKCKEKGISARFVSLNSLLKGETIKNAKDEDVHAEKAWVFVAKNFVDIILKRHGATKEQLFKEVNSVQHDNTYFDTRRKRVLNKLARDNTMFADYSQKADIAQKKSTVHDFKDMPLLSLVRKALYELFGEKVKLLIAEENRYKDGGEKKNGIGWHGDEERRIVLCIRLGKNPSMPMYFRWYYQSKVVGKTLKLDLNAGDLYVMSEIAVGTNWKFRSKVTLRHSTGAPKFTQ